MPMLGRDIIYETFLRAGNPRRQLQQSSLTALPAPATPSYNSDYTSDHH